MFHNKEEAVERSNEASKSPSKSQMNHVLKANQKTDSDQAGIEPLAEDSRKNDMKADRSSDCSTKKELSSDGGISNRCSNPTGMTLRHGKWVSFMPQFLLLFL